MTVAILLPGSCPQQVPAGSVLPAVGRALRPPIHSFPGGGSTRILANQDSGAGRLGHAGSGSPWRVLSPQGGWRITPPFTHALSHALPSPTCTDACTHTRAHGNLHTVTLHSQTPTHPVHTPSRTPSRRRAHLAGAHPAVSPACRRRRYLSHQAVQTLENPSHPRADSRGQPGPLQGYRTAGIHPELKSSLIGLQTHDLTFLGLLAPLENSYNASSE